MAEEKKVVEEKLEEKPKMPATAVFEASSRVMSDKEKEVMMNRVQEAKRQLGMQDDGYSSPSVRDPFQPVSSYSPASSYGSSATASRPLRTSPTWIASSLSSRASTGCNHRDPRLPGLPRCPTRTTRRRCPPTAPRTRGLYRAPRGG